MTARTHILLKGKTRMHIVVVRLHSGYSCMSQCMIVLPQIAKIWSKRKQEAHLSVVVVLVPGVRVEEVIGRASILYRPCRSLQAQHTL